MAEASVPMSPEEIVRAYEDLPPDELEQVYLLAKVAAAAEELAGALGLPFAGDHIGKQIEKLNPSDIGTAALLAATLAELFDGPATGADIFSFSAAPAQNVEADSLVEAAEPDQTPHESGRARAESEHVADQLDERAGRLLVDNTLGKSYDTEGKSLDEIAADIYVAVGSPASFTRSGDMIDAIGRIKQRLMGKTHEVIAKTEGVTRSAVQQWFVHHIAIKNSSATEALKEEKTKEQPTEESVIAPDSAPVPPPSTIIAPIPKPPISTVMPIAPSKEVALEAEPWHVSAASRLADVANIPNGLHEALKEHLNPYGSSNTSNNKDEATRYIRQLIIKQFSVLEAIPGLDLAATRQLSAVLGVPATTESAPDAQIRVMTVAARINQLTSKPNSKMTVTDLIDIFSTGFEVLIKRLEDAGRGQENIPDAIESRIKELCIGLNIEAEGAEILASYFSGNKLLSHMSDRMDDLQMALFELSRTTKLSTGLSAVSRKILDYLTYSTANQGYQNTPASLRQMLKKNGQINDDELIGPKIADALTELANRRNSQLG